MFHGVPVLFGRTMQTFVAHWQLSFGYTAAVIEMVVPDHRCKVLRYRARILISTTWPLSAKPRKRLDLAVKDLETYLEQLHAAFSGYMVAKWLAEEN